MKEKSPENWKIFNHLESLLDGWKMMGSWENDQEETVCIIRDKLGMESFEQEEILKVGEYIELHSISYNELYTWEGNFVESWPTENMSLSLN